ncbi:hypothetical protein COO60DRAFT_1703096 [Scenedesmus sp. NREL 46B-D3]|nr:hypothetical protein COO60DRAFT_1703096 [Scenedesmus sp. NREL 46B-D3]
MVLDVVGHWCSGGANSNRSSSSSISSSGSIGAVGAATALQGQKPAQATPLLLPGYGYAAKAAAAATLCPVGTWSIGLRSSLTPCQRCPAGLTTAREGAVSHNECRAGPGLYLQEGVRVCPPGTYQPDYHLQGSEACKPCATGVTTAGSAAAAAAECAFAQPGYGLTTCDNNSGCQAQMCGVGWYNVVVPPGYGVVYPLPADVAVSAVQLCSSGYNPGWNRQACTPCGVNIASRGNRTSAWDCFVLKGQGLQMLPSSSAAGNAPTRGAVDCWPGSVGMAVDTVIFNARPCDTCPRFMTTEQPLSSSKSDCKALPGYIPVAGSDPPTGASACPIGTFKPNIGNDAACTRCPGSTSTTDVGSVSAANCTVCLPGFGGWSPAGPACSLCDPGTYNNGTLAGCVPCPPGQTPNGNLTDCLMLPSPSPSLSFSPLPPSTCRPRPAASTITASDIDCPNSWNVLAPGSSYGLPPACVPPSGNCGSAGGQFLNRNALEAIAWGSAGATACVCKELRSQGHILKRVDANGRANPQGSRLGCVPIAAFLPASAALPTGPGVWVVDDVATATCWDAPSCWDMCFFCDGSRRYSAQTPAAQVGRLRTYREIETGTCSSTSCALAEPIVDQKTFAEACDRYAGMATPESQGSLPLVNGVWPFRPVQSSSAVLQLPRPVNLSGLISVDQAGGWVKTFCWAGL